MSKDSVSEPSVFLNRAWGSKESYVDSSADKHSKQSVKTKSVFGKIRRQIAADEAAKKDALRTKLEEKNCVYVVPSSFTSAMLSYSDAVNNRNKIPADENLNSIITRSERNGIFTFQNKHCDLRKEQFSFLNFSKQTSFALSLTQFDYFNCPPEINNIFFENLVEVFKKYLTEISPAYNSLTPNFLRNGKVYIKDENITFALGDKKIVTDAYSALDIYTARFPIASSSADKSFEGLMFIGLWEKNGDKLGDRLIGQTLALPSNFSDQNELVGVDVFYKNKDYSKTKKMKRINVYTNTAI